MNTSFLAPARLAPFLLLTKTVQCSAFSRRSSTARSIAIRTAAFAKQTEIEKALSTIFTTYFKNHHNSTNLCTCSVGEGLE